MRGRILLAMVLGLAAVAACSKKDSIYIEPGKRDGAPEPARVAVAKAAPAKAAPVKAEPGKSETARAEPAQALPEAQQGPPGERPAAKP